MSKEEQIPSEIRAKYWTELDTNEKLERLRQEVKRRERTIARLITTVDKLRNHYHLDGTAELAVPFDRPSGDENPTRRIDSEYF